MLDKSFEVVPIAMELEAVEIADVSGGVVEDAKVAVDDDRSTGVRLLRECSNQTALTTSE